VTNSGTPMQWCKNHCSCINRQQSSEQWNWQHNTMETATDTMLTGRFPDKPTMGARTLRLETEYQKPPVETPKVSSIGNVEGVSPLSADYGAWGASWAPPVGSSWSSRNKIWCIFNFIINNYGCWWELVFLVGLTRDTTCTESCTTSKVKPTRFDWRKLADCKFFETTPLIRSRQTAL